MCFLFIPFRRKARVFPHPSIRQIAVDGYFAYLSLRILASSDVLVSCPVSSPPPPSTPSPPHRPATSPPHHLTTTPPHRLPTDFPSMLHGVHLLLFATENFSIGNDLRTNKLRNFNRKSTAFNLQWVTKKFSLTS
jgi:hypothetical protein